MKFNLYLTNLKTAVLSFFGCIGWIGFCFALGYHDVAMLLTGLFLLSLLIISYVLTIASKKKRLAHNEIKNKALRGILHL